MVERLICNQQVTRSNRVAGSNKNEFMILSGQQPNYLPWLGFFHKVSLSDKFIFVDTVQYEKKGVTNRNKIKTANGEQWLTVPVLTKGKFEQKVNEIEINNAEQWPKKHWKSIELNYRKAPYFSQYSQFFEEVYQKKWGKLSELNETIIRHIFNVLGIKVEIFKASDINPVGEKTMLLIDICRKVGADTYLSGRGAMKYVDEGLFRQNGLNHMFQDFQHPVYKQLHSEFIPNISIIDLLFNHGPESLDIVTGKNKVET